MEKKKSFSKLRINLIHKSQKCSNWDKKKTINRKNYKFKWQLNVELWRKEGSLCIACRRWLKFLCLNLKINVFDILCLAIIIILILFLVNWMELQFNWYNIKSTGNTKMSTNNIHHTVDNNWNWDYFFRSLLTNWGY